LNHRLTFEDYLWAWRLWPRWHSLTRSGWWRCSSECPRFELDSIHERPSGRVGSAKNGSLRSWSSVRRECRSRMSVGSMGSVMRHSMAGDRRASKTC